MLLDAPFSGEEVTNAVSRLKVRKAAHPDGLVAEHLKAGGKSMVIWLRNTPEGCGGAGGCARHFEEMVGCACVQGGGVVRIFFG